MNKYRGFYVIAILHVLMLDCLGQDAAFDVGTVTRWLYPSHVAADDLLYDYSFDSKSEFMNWEESERSSRRFSTPEETMNDFKIRYRVPNFTPANGHVLIHAGYSVFTKKSSLTLSKLVVNDEDSRLEEIHTNTIDFSEKQNNLDIGISWERVIGESDKLLNLIFDVSANLGLALANNVEVYSRGNTSYFLENGGVNSVDRTTREDGSGLKKNYVNFAMSTGAVVNITSNLKAKLLVGMSSFQIFTATRTPQSFYAPSAAIFITLPL
jgi:hypothetical protein